MASLSERSISPISDEDRILIMESIDESSNKIVKKKTVERYWREAWKCEFPWLDYDENTGMLCNICIRASMRNVFTTGSKSYQHSALTRHENQGNHKKAVELLTHLGVEGFNNSEISVPLMPPSGETNSGLYKNFVVQLLRHRVLGPSSVSESFCTEEKTIIPCENNSEYCESSEFASFEVEIDEKNQRKKNRNCGEKRKIAYFEKSNDCESVIHLKEKNLQKMSSTNTLQNISRNFVTFINKCPSPFHVVSECQKILITAGFQELKESDPWEVKPLRKYFVTKNKSTIVAFTVGGAFTAGNGFSIIGAHTDSPCLKVKPNCKKLKNGYLQVGVECYGSGIWHTWFDRDLTVAGRIIVKNGDSMEHKLVHIERPILRIPNIAIHLMRDTNEKFSPNKEIHLQPIIATSVQDELSGISDCTAKEENTVTDCEVSHTVLFNLLSQELAIHPSQVMDFELCVVDTQPATIGGAKNEFIFSPRLDNLFNCYCALQALIEASNNEIALQGESNIWMISLFDNEEVGSESAQGAASSFQELILKRLSSFGSPTAFEEAVAKSFIISADQAHAVHPNYMDKHDENHRPMLHKGPVIKYNCNQRYATTAITGAILKEIANKCAIPLQAFVARNDSPCGTTIGPIMATNLGIQTIDIGSPMLAMHSIREMCCTTSLEQSTALFKGFFEHYSNVRAMCQF